MQGIRVNAINPATVESNFFRSAGMNEEQAKAYVNDSAAVHPIGRVGVPADVAELAFFLTDGAKAGWLTGQCICLDGGRLLSAASMLNRN
jgi:NAD(P)-dependent dehydrogenase (short-subunit alcohol dehydrogenase family)